MGIFFIFSFLMLPFGYKWKPFLLSESIPLLNNGLEDNFGSDFCSTYGV